MFGMPNTAPSYSIVVETDNLPTISWDEFGQLINQLGDQIIGATSLGHPERPEIIFVSNGPGEQAEEFLAEVKSRVPDIFVYGLPRSINHPNGRYYQLKNTGARAANGEIIVFLDSDTILDDHWLANLLSPFKDNSVTIASLGCTFLSHNDWVSRTFALIWNFPIRGGSERSISNRPLYANNCAFQREWFLGNSFPENDGFKVDCTLLFRTLQAQKAPIARPNAYVDHLPLRGWRFVLWRAAVFGRDADRKCAILKYPTRCRRIYHALRRNFTRLIKIPIKVISGHRKVNLPMWQIFPSILLGWGFYGFASVTQLLRAIGMTSDSEEHIPEWIQHS